MIKAYSQRVTPPFSGTAQVAESARARAISMDGQSWEIHFARGSTSNLAKGQQKGYSRAANIRHSALRGLAEQGTHNGQPIDERILELARFLADADVPFPAADVHEYWLLDKRDGSPLSLIFSCVELETRETFPHRHAEWNALPSAVMPIARSVEELDSGMPPVNYQVESLVAQRAGQRPLAKWFHRPSARALDFPELMVREDWDDEQSVQLVARYLHRQAPRLLMVPNLSAERRLSLEHASAAHAMEVGRFYAMYPEVMDAELMSSIRVEARLRQQTGEEQAAINQRRDGVLYI